MNTDNDALVIMSCDSGRLDSYGGYKLLRSEYREQATSDIKPGEAAEEWLHAIHMLLTYPGWYPGDEPNPYIAVHDLYQNGDVLDEDMRLFAVVLRRHLNLVRLHQEI